jgi:Undecaprenyl-phosphate glucose phosphotransferase
MFALMNPLDLTSGRLNATPARRRLNRDGATLVSDLLPLCDFLGLLTAVLLVTATQLEMGAVGTGGTGVDFTPAVWGAAMVAPFMLYDPRFGARASHGRLADWLPAFGARFALFAAAVLLMAAVSHPLDDFPPRGVIAALAIALGLALVPRLLLARHVLRLGRLGRLKECVAVVGSGPLAERLVQTLRQNLPQAIELVGVFDDKAGHRARVTADDVAGSLDDLIALGRQRRIDWILLALPPTAEHRLQALTQRLEGMAVPIALCPQDIGLAPPYRNIAYLGDGSPVSLLSDRPLRRRDVLIKGSVDFLVGGLLTLLLLPLLALIALAIKLTSPGPVIFRQKRHAVNGQEFEIFKFRTMRWNPDAAGERLEQTARHDDRVTPIGRFLRSSSLDELPQLFNVLRGEMSLVGPRPHAVNMRTEDRLGCEITDTYAHRNRVKPGITGWAQVNGARGATDTTQQLRRRIELDLHYIDNWSLLLDLRILALTSKEVVRSSTAY